MIVVLNKVALSVIGVISLSSTAFAAGIVESSFCNQNRTHHSLPGLFWVSNSGNCSYTIGNCDQIIDNLKSQTDRGAIVKCRSSYAFKRVTNFQINSKPAGGGYTNNLYLQVAAAYRCGQPVFND